MINILLLVTIFCNLVLCEFGELLSVTVLYRHGNRSPRKLYKNDPYKDQALKIWPDGFGQLTNVGKKESFALGQWYREKYKSFIPKKYNNKFVRVLSSNLDRCLMSAACNLAGLYPPLKDQIWNEHLLWQPIPIHTSPEHLDGIIATDDIPCKNYYRLYQELMRTDKYTEILEANKNIFEYLSNHTGDHISDPQDVVALHDTLFVESCYNLTLPEWTRAVFPHDTLPLLTMTFALDTNNTVLGRLKSGRLIDYITTFFEDVLRNNTDSPKLLMLSGHDSTISRLMNVLGVYDYTWVEYAASLVFELRRKGNEVFIRIYFKDSKKLQDIILPQCKLNCNFDTFKNITKPFRINKEEWEKECSSG